MFVHPINVTLWFFFRSCQTGNSGREGREKQNMNYKLIFASVWPYDFFFFWSFKADNSRIEGREKREKTTKLNKN